MLDLDETFRKRFKGYYEHSDTISRSIKNIHVLQVSSKTPGGDLEDRGSLDEVPDVGS